MIRVRVGLAFTGVVSLALAGCAPAPVRQPATSQDLAAQAMREQVVGARHQWAFEGRFAASDGHDGGSGSVSWQQDDDAYVFTLRAPITGRSVRLAGGPDGAVLTGAGDGTVEGADGGALLRREFGWDVPVADLAWWVRGLRAPGSPAILTFGANGLPATLDQDGWRVEYRDWFADRNPPLPRKVYASREPYSVRMVVERWQDR